MAIIPADYGGGEVRVCYDTGTGVFSNKYVNASGGYTGVSSNNVTTDTILEALVRLNPSLDELYENRYQLALALIAAGEAKYQQQSLNRLSGLSLGGE